MKPKELPPPAQLMKFILGKWINKPIYVAAELGIADVKLWINVIEYFIICFLVYFH